MKKVTLKETENKKDSYPAWEINYDDRKENFGNIYKVIDHVDKIHEETGGNVEIILDFHTSRNKPHLKGILFSGEPYFNKIKLASKESIII